MVEQEGGAQIPNDAAARRSSIIGGAFGLGVFLSVHGVWISAVIMESFANLVTIPLIGILLWLATHSVHEMIRRRKGFAAGFLITFGVLMLLFGLCVALTVP